MISEETIDLHNSFHEYMEMNTSVPGSCKSSDDEDSISLQSTTHGSIYSQNLTPLSEGKKDELISPEKSYISDVKSYGAFSFEQIEGKTVLSEEKIAEFKEIQSKVNDAYANYKINEFILNTIKAKSTSWSTQIKTVTKYCEIQDKMSLICENGEVTNLLGLEEEDIKLSASRSMMLINKSAFHDHCVKVVESNLAKLKQQKASLQDEFGAHSMKAMVGILTRERKEQLELYRQVEDLQNQVRQLISDNTSIIQQLATLRQESSQNLQAATFELLRAKMIYINTVISTFKEKLDQSLSVDDNTKRKMETEGDNLKTQVTEMRDELKALQKTLKEYEKKEAESAKYKELIVEYGKLKKKLDLKRETLKILDEPNVSF